MSTFESIKYIRIGIVGKYNDFEIFLDILKNYNFIFYILDIHDIISHVSEIKLISSNLIDPRNHIFIISDGCSDIYLDDEDDLIYNDDIINDNFVNFDNSLSSIGIPDKLFHLSKISSIHSKILCKISKDNGSIINLNEMEINILALKLLKKNKLSLSEKMRQIRSIFKEIDLNNKLKEMGFIDIKQILEQYFKLGYQKKIIYHNYLYEIEKLHLSTKFDDVKNIEFILTDIHAISVFKKEMLDKLICESSFIIKEKLLKYLDVCKKMIVVSVSQGRILNSIDPHNFHKFLSDMLEITTKFELSELSLITQKEIDTINKIIIDHHSKEMEKITDLNKIQSILKIFASKDR